MNQNHAAKRYLPLVHAARLGVCVLVALLLLPTLAGGQIYSKRAIAVPSATTDPEKDKAKGAFAGGAALKTDPELERLLERAEQFEKQGRTDVAVVLWQKVLDESGDTLVTRDGRTYTSLALQVESMLAQLPPEGLKAYRLNADGEAKALLAAAGFDREKALAQVTRRYFLSSVGDDAALELASAALDRYDFVGASRLLMHVLDDYPDPSVSRSELLTRLAVANAKLGDSAAVAANVAALEQSPTRAPREVLAFVKRELEAGPRAAANLGGGALAWHQSPGGNAARTAQMRSLPGDDFQKTLTEMWSYEFPLSDKFAALSGMAGGGEGMAVYSGVITVSGRMAYPGGVVPGQTGPAAPNRESIRRRWQEGSWQPVQQLLFDGERVYLKTPSALTCWSTAGLSDKPLWTTESNNPNIFVPDNTAMMLAQMGMAQPGGPNRPLAGLETLLFADRAHASMSIADGVIYSIEGRRYVSEQQFKEEMMKAAQGAASYQWGVLPRRTRKNWLAAYDAAQGGIRWHRAADDSAKDATSVGFLSAPVPAGDLLLVPVTDGGAIFIYALAKTDGATVWKTYLCDEPTGGCSRYSPVSIAVEGSEAYVCAGTGVVFALESLTGAIRWATRYERSGKQNQQFAQAYGNPAATMLDLDGWDDDTIIPHGAALLVMASDNNRLLALDRRSGTLRWESPRTAGNGRAASYCLGVAQGGVFVAGKNVVRRYSISGGRLDWEFELKDKENSCGRGALTAGGIYLPVNRSVLRLDLEKGTDQGQVGVALISDAREPDPVGNLFSDGDKLWVVGLNRLAALTNESQRLEMLAQQITAGNAAARFQRMRLHNVSGRFPEALADLLAGREMLLTQGKPPEALTNFLGGLEYLGLERIPAPQAFELVALAQADLQSATLDDALRKDLQNRHNSLRLRTLAQVRQQKTPGMVRQVLTAAEQSLASRSALLMARQALEATARKEDADLLRPQLTAKAPEMRLLALHGLATALGAEAVEPLQPLLKDADETVRLAAARALVKLGERSALATLVEGLDSAALPVRSQSFSMLRTLTGQSFAYVAGDETAKRAAAVKRWREWLAGPGAQAKLNLPLADTAAYLGRTLVGYYNPGQVLEVDELRVETWNRKGLTGVWGCAGLPNGHRLLCDTQNRSVIEVDENGKEVWVKDKIAGTPFSVQRLENGNTLVACLDTQSVWEFTPEGKMQWQKRIEGHPRYARRLENGNTLVALLTGNRVVEVNPVGETVWQLPNMNQPTSAERLENGNTLVSQAQSGQVVEVEPSGKVVWSKGGLVSPFSAQRLPDGNTLVSDNQGVHEFDGQGAEVWTFKGSNIACAYRY